MIKIEPKRPSIYFTVERYTTIGEYIEAGSPVRYFEFNHFNQYMIIAIRIQYRSPFNPSTLIGNTHWQKAVHVYQEVKGLTDVNIAPYPKEISKYEALLRWLLVEENETCSILDAIETFNAFKMVESAVVLTGERTPP